MFLIHMVTEDHHLLVSQDSILPYLAPKGKKYFLALPGFENVNIKCENFFDFFSFSNMHNK